MQMQKEWGGGGFRYLGRYTTKKGKGEKEKMDIKRTDIQKLRSCIRRGGLSSCQGGQRGGRGKGFTREGLKDMGSRQENFFEGTNGEGSEKMDLIAGIKRKRPGGSRETKNSRCRTSKRLILLKTPKRGEGGEKGCGEGSYRGTKKRSCQERKKKTYGFTNGDL